MRAVKYLPLMFLLLALALLWGCGQLEQPAEPTTPDANAGADQTVFIDLQCQLDGSASSGNLAVYVWRTKTLPAGASTPSITSSGSSKAYFTPTTLGTYEFELELSNELGISTDEVIVNVVSFLAPTIEAGFYGVCSHLQSHDGETEEEIAQAAQLMADAGIQFVRFDFRWEHIEPQNDSFSFSKYDAIIAKLKEKNIKVLGILDMVDLGNDWSNPTYGDPTQVNHYADFVLNTVKHFGSDITFWQIWNEPNNQNFWTIPSATNYTKLLKAAYGAAKQGNPDSVVVLGGLVGNGKDEYVLLGMTFAKANFLPDIYAAEGKDYFDVAAIHPYNYATDISSTTALENAIATAESIMADYGDSGKELWLTELGPLYFPPEPVLFISDQGYTQTQVASWLTLIYTNLKTKCDKLFWYELRDYAGATSFLDPNWEGLLESDYTSKEAYSAYKNLSK